MDKKICDKLRDYLGNLNRDSRIFEEDRQRCLDNKDFTKLFRHGNESFAKRIKECQDELVLGISRTPSGVKFPSAEDSKEELRASCAKRSSFREGVFLLGDVLKANQEYLDSKFKDESEERKEKEAKKRYKILAFELFSGMPIMEHPEKEGTFFAMHLDTALYAMEKI
ncbi:hypothetical protein HON36_03810 [Candidatus Parcubacteria bacterium]|nr:hypothetical protein [Candidatus Parcubacteria bacterium]MBT7228049.1 hypothetical protein [Candidatus Parcubacteria bacterium]